MSLLSETNLKEYIEQQAELDLLRFITCGSVDDGKSTLIGRILYEAQLIFDDQMAELTADSKKRSTKSSGKVDIDLSLLVDGLTAEREQGITIDVAYRFFNTDHRKFIVADTPGHEQYTRNMVTGASTADVAVILVDAEQGILTQTQRHSFIVSLLGIKHVVLAVNKMDLVDFDKTAFDAIVANYAEFAQELKFSSITTIPLSALEGDNVVDRSVRTEWYKGPTLLGYLETVEVAASRLDHSFRFPVQWVNRPSSDFRGYSGTVAAGSISVGEEVRALPSGQTANVKGIFIAERELETAIAEQAITVCLDKEIDVSRGDVLVAAASPCEVSDQFETTLVWMDREEGFIGRSYSMLIGSVKTVATITAIKYRYDINNFDRLSAESMKLNDIGEVAIRLDRAVPFESYNSCKPMGAFVLVDRYTHATVGAGMINFSLRRADNIHRQSLAVNREAREKLSGHRGRVLWFTGLSGSGKSTVASALEQSLHLRGMRTYILDGDNIRHGLNNDLGFTDADRVENIRRIAEVAKLMVDAGLVVITSFISPFRSERDIARSLFKEREFVEIYVNVPLEVAEHRDPKGLYKKARRGELPNFTGIDSEYEVPENPEIEIKTAELSVDECVSRVLKVV
jgi:bifunctional enzyme CysN/CysC